MKQLIALFGIALCLAGHVRAQALLNEAAVANLPAVAPPFTYTFTATSTQALTLTLTDLQAPAAFGALQVAVTSGDTLIGSASVAAGAKTTLAISAAQGTVYQVNVVGTPDATQGIGLFGVCVAPASSPSSCVAGYSTSGNIQTPSAVSSNGKSQLNANFTTSATGGTYTVTVTDDVFPAALSALAGGIAVAGVPQTPSISWTTGQGSTPQVTQITLPAKTLCQLILGTVAGAPSNAGLYGVRITDPNNAVVFDRTVPVGTLTSATSVDNPATEGLNLVLTDFKYPAALTTAAAAVTQGSRLLAALPAPGTVSNFMAPSGSVQIWQYAAAGTQSGVYDLNLEVYEASGTGTKLYSTTQVANPTGAATTAYAFVPTLPSAGTYHLAVNDFAFPSVLAAGPTATVAQNGALLAVDSSGNFSAQAGQAVVLVTATAPASGEGIFGVTVSTTGTSPKILLDQTQALGGDFVQQTINVGATGQYQATLTDLGTTASANASLLAPLQQLAVTVSLGSQVVGKIYGGGAFDFPTPGNYVVTVLATPSASGYGLYGLNIAAAAPTLTFTASPTSVAVGKTVQLTWSSQYASACTAGGASGWTGPQGPSGSTAVAITASATLTLTCTGLGGSITKTAAVTATPAAASGGGGGGGSVDPTLLLMLAGLLAATSARARAFGLSWRHEVGFPWRLRRASARRPSVSAQQVPAAPGPAAR